ncbi:major capsid protein [Clostridium sp.]|uniref:major capsid protein n=1 Tax=Clostridium sp. TaxID=1506 RepID=UPI003463A423
MAITLKEAKVSMADKVDQMVIDEFRRNSLLLEQLIFDDAVSPGTGGSTLTYGYTRLKTPGTAQFREINNEYTSQEAKREKHTVDLKIFGGGFELDRILANTSGAIDEVDFQLKEKIKAASNLFHYTVINGDSAVDSKSFDGLDKALAGSSTELNKDSVIDLSTSDAVDTNYKDFLDLLDEFLSELDGTPNMLMGNAKLMSKIRACARRAGYLTQAEDAFGKKVDSYNNIPLVDLGYYVDNTGTIPTVKIQKRTISANETDGLTDLFAAGINLGGFHGVTVKGDKIIKTYLPDLNAPGAVKKGEVEMVGAIALKNSRSAGVLRNIKVR